jgi:uncharacterized protein YqfA (UPF0365 family)
VEQIGVVFIVLIILGIIFVLSFLNYFVPIGLWLTAYFSGVKVSLFAMIGMRLRKVPPAAIINPLINATKAGLSLESALLEAHYLAGGNVDRVVKALISADKANLGLSFQRATAIDLAGRDVLEAVKVSVNPKVIETPKVAAVAKDGIQLVALAKVTVRANIERLVGGAGEETILARVGEGIVSTIGSSATHKDVLANPDLISKTVLAKGLDSGTAFEILSIDIADVDVGRNIGAMLQTDQAEADKRIAQPEAEKLLFTEMFEICLWGNATDLSLLTNLSFPMIRYQIGDLGIWAGPGPCSCGLPFPRLQSIQGREDDMLMTADGTFLSSVFIRHFVGVSLNRQLIREWQFEQTARNEFVFRYVALTYEGLEKNLAQLRDSFRMALGVTANVQMWEVTEIPPSPTGKTLWIINRRKQKQGAHSEPNSRWR